MIGVFDDHREPLRLGLEYLGRPFSPLQLTWGVGVSIVKGGISHRNPGTEIAALLSAVPFGRARPGD